MTTAEESPHSMLTKARKALRRWDIEIASSGTHQWLQTTSTRKKFWLIIEHGEEVFFDPLD